MENVDDDYYNVYNIVQLDGIRLREASDKMRNTFEIVHAAVGNEGTALAYASDRLQHDVKILDVAIKQDGYAINYVPQEFKDEYTRLALGWHSHNMYLCMYLNRLLV